MTEPNVTPPATPAATPPATPPANTGPETPAWASGLNDAINSLPEKLAQMMPAPKTETTETTSESSEDTSILDDPELTKPKPKARTKAAPAATPPAETVTPPAAKSGRARFVEWFGHP